MKVKRLATADNRIEPRLDGRRRREVVHYEFQFMGYSEIRGVLAEGQVIGDAVRSARYLAQAVDEARAIARQLYGSAERQRAASEAVA